MTTPGPSIVFDAAPLVAGAVIFDTNRGHGMLAAAIPTGFAFEHPLLKEVNQLDPAGTEYRYLYGAPSAGAFIFYPDGSFEHTGGVPNVATTGSKEVWKNGESAGVSTYSITTEASTTATVTGVTVAPSTATVIGGGTHQFTATVAGTNSPSQSVEWTKSGAGTLSVGGLFTAPAATASEQTITVTATSVADGAKSGSATITISSNATSVVVSPNRILRTGAGNRTLKA